MSDFREKLRQKLQNLKNPKNKFQNRRWSPPKDGSPANVRLIAYPHSSDPRSEPFAELWFHYNVGSAKFGILCPKLNANSSCPLCTFAEDMRKSDNDADKATGKKISAQQRGVAVLVDRADPSLTPKFWSFNKSIYIDLLEYLNDGDYEDFLDPYEGHDITVKSEKTEGKMFASPEIKIRPKTSALGTKEQVEAIIRNVPKISEVFPPMTAEQIQSKMSEWYGLDEEDAEEASQESVRGGGSKAAKVDDVDKEFEDLLG